jgi:hypothetical protein
MRMREMMDFIGDCEKIGLLEDRLSDLQAQFKLLKSKREQLQTDLSSTYGFIPRTKKEWEYEKRNRKADDERFNAQTQDERERDYADRLAKQDRKKRFRRSVSDQIIELNHQLAVLKAQIEQERHRGTIKGHFVTVTSQKNGYADSYMSEFGQLVFDADENLPDPASRAITDFIGHPPGRPDPEHHGVGFMHERRLEDAYSPNPSEEGREIRQQLEQHFAPVKEALRQLFGDRIELYRAQMTLQGDEKHRNVLSWTGDLKFAEHINGRGGELLTKTFPLDDIVWISDRANQIEFIMRNHREN